MHFPAIFRPRRGTMPEGQWISGNQLNEQLPDLPGGCGPYLLLQRFRNYYGVTTAQQVFDTLEELSRHLMCESVLAGDQVIIYALGLCPKALECTVPDEDAMIPTLDLDHHSDD